MAIAHSSSTTSQTANNNSNTSLSVTGLSTSSSNLNVVHLVGFADGTDVNPTMTTPSGWTKLGETLETGGLSNTTWSAVYWKFGNGATSQTFSWSNAGQMVAVASVYTGVDATTPIPDYTLEVKGTTNSSYTVSVTTTGAGWIVSGFGNRSGHTFSALAETQRGTATLASASSIVVQDSAGDISSGSITRTATGSGNTSNGAEWVFRLKADTGGGGVAHTLTITDDVGMAETGESVLGVEETITDTVGLSDSTVRVHTPGSITTPTTAPDFTALIEIAFDDTPKSTTPVYTDVAEYVRASSIPSMSRGRSNEFDSQAQAGRASLEFVNTDDDLTVGNTSSPFDPLQIRRPFRVRLAYGGNVYPVWAGLIDSWDNGRDETTGVVRMQAADRLARASSVRLKPLVSAEILSDAPSAYYPLNDAEGSVTAGDQSTRIGNPPLVIDEFFTPTTSFVDFGTGGNLGPDDVTNVTLTPDSSTVGKYLTAASPDGWGYVDPATGYTVEAFFKATASADTQPIINLGMTNGATELGAALEVSLDTSGRPYANFGLASVTATGIGAFDDAEWHHVAAAVKQTSGSVHVYLWVDGVYIGTSSTSLFTLYRQDQLYVGVGRGRVYEGQLAHVAIFPAVLSTSRVADHAAAGLDSFARETSTARFTRLCRTAGIPSTMHDVDGTGSSTMCAQPTAGVGLLDLVRQCADAEKGVAYVRSSGVLALAPRHVRYGADVGLTLDARTQLDAAFTLTTDDALLVNDVTASRPGGATIRVTDNDSIDAYDIHDDTVTLYVDSDEQVVSAAEWTVFTGSQPTPRCLSVTVDAVQFGATGGDVVSLLEADMGTRMSITNLPSDTSATATLDLFIEGVSVRLEKHGPVFTFTTSPVGASGSVWIIEDPLYGGIEDGNCIAF